MSSYPEQGLTFPGQQRCLQSEVVGQRLVEGMSKGHVMPLSRRQLSSCESTVVQGTAPGRWGVQNPALSCRQLCELEHEAELHGH